MNVQEAGDAARYFHTGSSAPTGQIMTDGGIVQLEGGVCNAVRNELEQRGHHLMRAPNGGGYQVWRHEQEGLFKDVALPVSRPFLNHRTWSSPPPGYHAGFVSTDAGLPRCE